MKNNTLGFIFSENPEVNLSELTSFRSLAAVPVGGRYRIIDFVLSNMVNSGIIKVGIATAHKNQSLADHLGSGKDWDMARKENGLFMLPPPEIGENAERVPGGIDYICRATDYLKRSRQEYVVLSDCNTICNIDYDEVLDFHIEKDADITVVHTKVGELTSGELEKNILFDIDENSRVKDIQVYPSRQKIYNSYMHMFLLKKELLLNLAGDCAAHDRHSISKDLLLANLNSLKIYSYEFSGYKKKIDSIQSFFEFNLDLLKKEVRDELFGDDSDAIYTKVKDTVPTHYKSDCEIENSFIADGCEIEGKVENSIIFRGVHVGKGAGVKNSIIMQNSHIMENCVVENSIFDKEVVLRKGKKIIGQETYPVVIGKKTIV